MAAKIIFYLVIGIVLALVLRLLMGTLLPAPKVELTPELQTKFEKARPTLSSDQQEYLALLERNAISGGPPKDGIPAIDQPNFTSAAEGDSWLLPHDIVFGVDYKGFVAAFPQRILVWHEISNLKIEGEQLSVSYCPLTGTAIGFRSEVAPGVQSTLGVSGKLINSNLLMYDRASDSYWPQIVGTAINGPAKGRQLEEFPVVWTTWERWKKKYPDTKVLSRDTGFIRNYGEGGDPYGSYLRADGGYYTSDRLLFRPIYSDDRLGPKEVVIGIRDADGNAAAVLKDYLRRQGKVEVTLEDRTVVIEYDPELDFYQASIKETGEWVNAFDSMWFPWFAFYPNTSLVK